MAESPASSSTTRIPCDNIMDEDSSELAHVNMLLESDSVLQGLNESRSELLSHVQSLKKDLQDWQGKLDTEVNTYNNDIGDLKNSLNSHVDELTHEFQELKNTLKEQLAATTSKLVEFDTSVEDCAQYLEGLNTNCAFEKTLFDDLIADLGLQNYDKGDISTNIHYSSSNAPLTTMTLEEVEE